MLLEINYKTIKRVTRASSQKNMFFNLGDREIVFLGLFPFRSSLITIECAHIASHCVQGLRREIMCGEGREMEREFRKCGRIINDDSDHVSGTVHTITSLGFFSMDAGGYGWQVSSSATQAHAK